MGKRVGQSKRFNKTNIQKAPDRTGLYVISNKDGRAQYVGISSRVRSRLAQHLEQKDIPGAHNYQIRTLTSKRQAEKLEGSYIRRLRPKHNILKKRA